MFSILSTGKRLQTILFPAKFVQSLTWGGENMDTLFVGTSVIVYSIQSGKTVPVKLPEADGHLYQETGLGRNPAAKMDMRYATCLNEKARSKHGFKSKVKKAASKIKKLFKHWCFDVQWIHFNPLTYPRRIIISEKIEIENFEKKTIRRKYKNKINYDVNIEQFVLFIWMHG